MGLLTLLSQLLHNPAWGVVL